MFQFEFGEQKQPQPEEFIQRIPGNLIQLSREQIPVMGELVHLTHTTLYKRALVDINYEIAQRDDMVTTNELVQAFTTSSDLITGVYEGGCKTWECSLELVDYLYTIRDELKNKDVIELGCGSALPGIFCLLSGAHVDFQDYNEDVLRFVTLPNITLNQSALDLEIDDNGLFETEIDLCPGQSQFYAGDWSMLAAIITKKYDVILTCETIYSSANIPHLLLLIKSILKPNGIVFLAAKHTYFGCSGSMPIFKSAAQEFGFQFKTVFENNQGIRREIIMLQLIL